MTGTWTAILTAAARAENKSLAAWAAECDHTAAAMSATVPAYVRHPKRKPEPLGGTGLDFSR